MDFQKDVQIQVGDSCYLDVFREAKLKTAWSSGFPGRSFVCSIY